MSTYTARCIVVRCDVKDCDELGEILCRDGATNSINGWLEVYPHGGSSDLSRRKFICPKHAKALDLGSFDSPAEVPLSQALQDPRFQKPGTISFMAAMNVKQIPVATLMQGNKVLEFIADHPEVAQLPDPGEKRK